jgi:pimeloyl-ACP methyl ester carboxylesterase
LSHRAWEPQLQFLADAGYQVIAYDRRGFGHSSKPYEGYDYSTLAKDLQGLILGLDLNDVVLVGFSMGGGEVVRYLTEYGSSRIAKAVLMSSIIPLVPQKDDNPDGVPQEDLKGIMQALQDDRVAFMKQFANDFFNAKKTDTSDEQVHYTWSIAANASPRATIEAANAWASADFRDECKNVTVPTLIIHGTGDEIVPIATAGDQAAALSSPSTKA